MIGHLNPAVPLLSAAVIILAEIPAAVQISCCHTLIPMGAVYFLLALSIPGNVSSREGEGGYSGQTTLSPAPEQVVFLQTLLTVWAVGSDILG